MNSLTTKLIKIFDVNINTDYCANTAILYKESLDKYTFIIHLIDDNRNYVPCPDDVLASLAIGDTSYSSNIELYNPNMGCFKIKITSDMFSDFGTDSTEFSTSLLMSVIGLTEYPNKVFKIPITIIPGHESEDNDLRRSKAEDNYATGGNHAESKHPKFRDLIHYMF